MCKKLATTAAHLRERAGWRGYGPVGDAGEYGQFSLASGRWARRGMFNIERDANA
jgi:hypothetical protein